MSKKSRKLHVDLQTVRIQCHPWFHKTQPKEIPYVSSNLVNKIFIPDAPSEYQISEMGCLHDMGKFSENKYYKFSDDFHAISSKDVSILFKRPIDVEKQFSIVEEISTKHGVKSVVKKYPCLLNMCKLNLEGPVILIDIPNGPSEFKLMIYDKVLPISSKNGILLVQDVLNHIPESWTNLTSDWDGKLPKHDKQNSFNFSTILQTTVVFEKPVQKQPFARIVYYDIKKSNGDSLIECYKLKTSRKIPTKLSHRYNINEKGKIIKDLKQY